MENEAIIIKPLLTEKANAMRDGKKHRYAFQVDPRANKLQIRNAVEKLFKVKTTACSIVNVSGKQKTMGLAGGKRATGFTSSWKKAYVTLVENQKIDQFEGV
ncbi:MAG: 50S ribosomal protein L23 [Spirochaetales bacterium]